MRVKSSPVTVRVTSAALAPTFSTINRISTDQYAPPLAPADQPVSFVLHGSTGFSGDYGDLYSCTTSAEMGHVGEATFKFRVRNGADYDKPPFIQVRPEDAVLLANSTKLETYWFGYVHNVPAGSVDPTRFAHNYTEIKIDALYDWFFKNYPQASKTKVSLTGQSMGGWGSITYGLRRPRQFASIFALLPRWRQVVCPDYDRGLNSDPELKLSTGENYLQRMDMISYIKNLTNEIPFVAWAIGRNDGFASFESQIEAVNAMRSANRGFAFSWNNGDHSAGPQAMDAIMTTYSPSQYELGKGYPIFLNSSLDQNPSVDLVGGINLGYRWRNLTETTSGFQVEVSNILGSATVDVLPHSKVFGVAPAQRITIPSGQWKTVTFSK